MIDFGQLTLFCYIAARMSGFVVFSPVFGRRGIPGIVRAGFVLVLSLTVVGITPGSSPVPSTLIELGLRIILELFLGFLLGFVMQLFLSFIPQMAGEVIDTQLGFTMGRIYDAGSQSSMTVTSTLINIFMFMLFFAANGHHTLMRILLTSGDLVPFGTVTFGPNIAEVIVQLFINCSLLGMKLALPILAAELMGQVGMGILMKAIPQINVFAINIELKVVIGLLLLMLLIAPFSEFLLAAENQMLSALQSILRLSSP